MTNLPIKQGLGMLVHSPHVGKPHLTMRVGRHLFIDNDTNKTNQQHKGELKFPQTRATAWQNILEARFKRLSDMNIDYRFLIAPDKQTVYRAILPPEFNVRLIAPLLALPFVVDVAPTLAAISPLIDVYAEGDSHWNYLGAYLAAQILLVSLLRPTLNLEIAWSARSAVGDLGVKLIPPQPSDELFGQFPVTSQTIFDNAVPNNGRIRIFSRPIAQSDPPSVAMIFGDSFSYNLMHFLKEAFDVCIQVHSFAIDFELIERVRPDFVVSELTERFMLRLPSPGDGNSLALLWVEKLLLGERPIKVRVVAAEALVSYPQRTLDILEVVGDLSPALTRLLFPGSAGMPLTDGEFSEVCHAAMFALSQASHASDFETAERLALRAGQASLRQDAELRLDEVTTLEILGLMSLGSSSISDSEYDRVIFFVQQDQHFLPLCLYRIVVKYLESKRRYKDILQILRRLLKSNMSPELEAIALILIIKLGHKRYPTIESALRNRLSTQLQGCASAYIALLTDAKLRNDTMRQGQIRALFEEDMQEEAREYYKNQL